MTSASEHRTEPHDHLAMNPPPAPVRMLDYAGPDLSHDALRRWRRRLLMGATILSIASVAVGWGATKGSPRVMSVFGVLGAGVLYFVARVLLIERERWVIRLPLFLSALVTLWGSIGLVIVIDEIPYYLAYRRWPNIDLQGFGVWLSVGPSSYVTIRILARCAKMLDRNGSIRQDPAIRSG